MMKPQDIHLEDWQRIFIGLVPGSFYLEVIIRTAVIYAILQISMRLMGKRMASQLSRTEMVAMVAIAASIGIPIMSPTQGLLPALICAVVIVLGERIISTIGARNEKAEFIFEGGLEILVEDSVLQLGSMLHCRVTRERVLAQLRTEGIYHLGKVKRLYMEANGSFSLVENPDPAPGLSVLPDFDTTFRSRQKKAPGYWVCATCGNPSPLGNSGQVCTNCHQQHWTQAVA